MDGIPNWAQRLFPMDFLEINTKLLYSLCRLISTKYTHQTYRRIHWLFFVNEIICGRFCLCPRLSVEHSFYRWLRQSRFGMHVTIEFTCRMTLLDQHLPCIDKNFQNIAAGSTHPALRSTRISFNWIFLVFILGKFDVYVRKLINNIRILYVLLILGDFSSCLWIHKNIKPFNKNTTEYFSEVDYSQSSGSLALTLLQFAGLCLQSFNFGFISLVNIRMLEHIFIHIHHMITKYRHFEWQLLC